MNDLPPEVLIYIQKIKDYFKKNKESYDYFLKNVDEDIFFEHFAEISLKNFKDNGSPELTVDQLEVLNKTIKAICVIKEPEYFTYNIWWNLGKLGLVCLN